MYNGNHTKVLPLMFSGYTANFLAWSPLPNTVLTTSLTGVAMKEFSLTFQAPRSADPGHLFFDIETTGLSADRAMVYLIGCAWFSEGCWHLKQWFADTREAEKDLLKAFSSHTDAFHTLVHYNGDGFDIPFLTKRFEKLRLPSPFSRLQSQDLYRQVKPLRKLLGLCDLKLKSLERFLRIEREDKFTGGQLIELYDVYLGTRDPKLERFLMLHNEEDIVNMPALLPILDYRSWCESGFTFTELRTETYRSFDGQTGQEAFLKFQSTASVPHPFTSHHPSGAVLAAGGPTVTLRLPLLQERLKHFYPNYRDYYYLPMEDRAIHKSVGEFVDKAYRIKATPANCFIARDGLFLPLAEPGLSPAFRRDVKSKDYYLECAESTFRDPQTATVFLQDWLKRFLSGK